MLKDRNFVIVIFNLEELKKEGVKEDFFKEENDYAIEIRNLETDESFLVYQKLYELKGGDEKWLKN